MTAATMVNSKGVAQNALKKTTTTATTQAKSSGNTLLEVGVELLGVGLLTLVAGISDETGKIIVMIMAGFWMIYLVGPGAPVISRLGADFSAAAKQ